VCAFFCYVVYNALGDIVTLCIYEYYQSRTILLSDKHNYIDLVFWLLFLRLLLVSSVRISHHQVSYWFTKN
jgi:hypothetical protein